MRVLVAAVALAQPEKVPTCICPACPGPPTGAWFATVLVLLLTVLGATAAATAIVYLIRRARSERTRTA